MSSSAPTEFPVSAGFGDACVVLATYNERPNLEQLIPILLNAVPGARIIVVDDSSPDGTPALLESMAATEPRLVPVIRPGKQGYGTAVLAGFRQALDLGARRVATMDADFSHDPVDVPRLLAAVAEGSGADGTSTGGGDGTTALADVAIGSRYVGGVRILNWEISRLLLSLFANRYVKTILGFRVEDATSGFRAYRRPALEALTAAKIRSVGYSFLVEILYTLHRSGFRIAEVPITYTERRVGQSKMSKKVIREAVMRPWLLRIRGR